jgi:hypothetical protein
MGSTEEGVETDGPLARLKEKIQAAYVAVQGQTGGFAKILTSLSSDIYSVTRIPGGSCGVTFISKAYAITAAHCVGGVANYNTFFEADRIMTTNLNTGTPLTQSESVSGTYPNWTVGHTLTGSDGYATTPWSCKIVYRCSASGDLPTPNCTDAATSSINGKDIALIVCPNRPVGGSTGFVTVNTGNPSSGGVVVNWFHEVLNLQTSSSDSQHNVPTGNWTHYGNRDANYLTSNFHYNAEQSLKFLPLQSAQWPDGTNYSINSGGLGTDVTWNDVPACHGMSGSGSFINGTSTLLGPVTFGGALGTQLCASMTTLSHGGAYMAYGNAPTTRVLEALPQVQSDR